MLRPLLLSLLLAASAVGQHDPSFCSLTPRTGVSLPEAPPAFYLYVTSKESDTGQIVTASEYFDDNEKKSSFFLGVSNTGFRMILNHETKQAMVIDRSSSSIPGNCRVQQINDYDLLIGVELIPGYKVSVPSKFFFFGLGNEGIANRGSDNIDGIPVTRFYSCYYMQNFDTSLEINWYFKDVNTNPTPVRITLRSKSQQKVSNSVIDVTNYRRGPPRWAARTSPFMTPPGVYCMGMQSSRRLPKIPDKFSIRMEELVSNYSEPVSMREAYDFTAQLSQLERQPSTIEEPSKFGPGKLLYMHDFRTQAPTYVINLNLGNCSFEKLSGDDWDSRDNLGQVRMKNPKEFFGMDWENVQYKGSGTFRGIMSDVFIGFKRLGTAPLFYNTTIEWYFVDKMVWNVSSNRMEKMAVPIAMKTTSEAPWLNAWMYMYDFEIKNLDFHRHEIGQCFSDEETTHFLIFFPLPNEQARAYVRQQPNQMMYLTLPMLSAGTGISSLRIVDPEVRVSSTGNTALLELTVTGNPPGGTGISISAAESRIKNFVAGGNLVTLLSDLNGKMIVLKASASTTTEVRLRNMLSVGYSAGALIGLGLAMAVLGVALGIGVMFGINKARGSGLDPFKPQRM